MAVDQAKIRKAVRDILEAIGEDPDREGLVGTPDRVAENVRRNILWITPRSKRTFKSIICR